MGLVVLIILSGCARSTPAATLMPTPTPKPTPTPTPLPQRAFTPDLDPFYEPAGLGHFNELLEAIPKDNDVIVLVDSSRLTTDSTLRGMFGVDSLELLPGFLPIISNLVDRAVIASDSDGDSVIVVLYGGLEIDSLLSLAENFGVTIEGQPEVYRTHKIWNGDVFGLVSVSLSEIDDSTILFSQGDIDGSSSSLQIKASLDAVDGISASVISDAQVRSLTRQTPAGLVTVLSTECRILDRSETGGLSVMSRCMGSSISADIPGEGVLSIQILVSFADRISATDASPEIRARLLHGMPTPEESVEVYLRLDGSSVRLRLVGNADELGPTLTWLMPQ